MKMFFFIVLYLFEAVFLNFLESIHVLYIFYIYIFLYFNYSFYSFLATKVNHKQNKNRQRNHFSVEVSREESREVDELKEY